MFSLKMSKNMFILMLVWVWAVGGLASGTGGEEARVVLWADAAYEFLADADCEAVKFTSGAECKRASERGREEMSVYAAYRSRKLVKKLVSVLPDGSLSRQGPHDAILVLDPYPLASFGHLVLLFQINYNASRSGCLAGNGIYTTSGDCMMLADKSRCHNMVDREGLRSESSYARRCEIDFLPLVQVEGLTPKQDNQLLECITISGFAPCPEKRPKDETSKIICNPLDSNRHRCRLDHEMPSHLRCRLLETCDHALIMAGGWNRDHSQQKSATNVANFYRMLRHNGFHRQNIKVYYANGAHASKLLGEDMNTIYPSVMKLSFRYHVQKVCQSPLCADSLVLYLNSPSTKEGHMLLWDIDGNGQMEEGESYSLRELASDLHDCKARQVYVFADQSYAGLLVSYFGRYGQRSNVIVLGSGQEEDYSHNGEFTHYWTRSNQSISRSCVTQLHESSHLSVLKSRPTIHDGSDGTIRTTVFGAPCDIVPPFSREELRSKYLGCQNVPTLLWLRRFVSNKPGEEEEEEDEDDQNY